MVIAASERAASRLAILSIAVAVIFLIITLGAGVLSTAGVGAAFGTGAGSCYVFGLFLGTNLVALIVTGGWAR